MKNNIRIQDDLFEFVNREELDKKEIPDDLPAIGGFIELGLDVEKILINEFETLIHDIDKIDDIHLKNAVIIFDKIVNNKIDSKSAVWQLLPKLNIINNINSVEDLNNNLLDLYNNNIILPFTFGIDVNMKNTNQYCVYFSSKSTILPDTTYYLDKSKRDSLLVIWIHMVKKIMNNFDNISEVEIDGLIKNALKFDLILSKIVKSQVEWADYISNYNPYNINDFNSKTLPLEINDKLFKVLFKKNIDQVIVYDPKFIENFNLLINPNTIVLYKSWAMLNYVIDNCIYLNDDLRILAGIYARHLNGTKQASNVKRFAFKTVAFSMLSEPIGIYYGKKYLGQQAKDAVIDLTKGLIESYKKRLSTIDWLEEKTREKAILKLDKMNLKIGYPDKPSEFYNHLTIDTNKSVYQIVDQLITDKKAYNNSKLFEQVDKDKWHMPGHMVNACYDPHSNDITFPAAILQKPFYGLDQSIAANLGGIGVVIGHEISHAFDNNGARCDENGNLNNWWTENDYQKFKDKTELMIEQFDNLPLGNGKVNGQLVVSENIADVGGMAASLMTLEQTDQINYQDFFINYARIWSQKSRDEYSQLLLAIDVHAPVYWRTNKIVQNFKQWYDAFNVTSNDKMYLEENKRLEIW